MSLAAGTPHLPTPAQIEAYGNGGFRFGGMSHRGSILCMPTGIWAWPVAEPDAITADSLALVLAAGDALDFVLIGTGRDFWRAPDALRARFAALKVSLDVMPTGAAVRTYNVLFAERRRAAAALIAVD